MELLRGANISEIRREELVNEIANIKFKLKESYRRQNSQEELKVIKEIEKKKILLLLCQI